MMEYSRNAGLREVAGSEKENLLCSCVIASSTWLVSDIVPVLESVRVYIESMRV